MINAIHNKYLMRIIIVIIIVVVIIIVIIIIIIVIVIVQGLQDKILREFAGSVAPFDLAIQYQSLAI